MGRRLCRRHARSLPRPPRRPRGAPHLRRVDHEPDAVEDVGPQDRRHRRGRRNGRSGRGAGGCLPQHSRLVEPPGAPPSLRSPDGDVALPAARAAGGRSAARSGAGCRPPHPHADPHRRAVRPLPRRPGLQPEGDRRRPQVSRPRGGPERLRALPHARLPLRGLRSHVPRPVPGGHGGGPGADRHHARGAPAHPLAADGRLRRGLPADEAARAGALRQVAGDHRPGAARRPGALLLDHRDDALRAGGGPFGARPHRRRPRRPGPRSSRRSCGCRRAGGCTTTPSATCWRWRRRC